MVVAKTTFLLGPLAYFQKRPVSSREGTVYDSDSCLQKRNMNSNTVDRRNPAPVDIVNILSFTGFIPGGAGFLPSTVSLRKINYIYVVKIFIIGTNTHLLDV